MYPTFEVGDNTAVQTLLTLTMTGIVYRERGHFKQHLRFDHTPKTLCPGSVDGANGFPLLRGSKSDARSTI